MRSQLFVTLCWLQICMQWSSLILAIDLVDPVHPAPIDPDPVPNIPASHGSSGTSGDGSIVPGDGSIIPGDDSSPGIGPPSKLNNPGALSEGKDPEPSENDEEIDIAEIGEKLHDLIDFFQSALDSSSASATTTQSADDANSASTTPTLYSPSSILASPIITAPPLASGTQACQAAHVAYADCSSASSSAFNFTSSNRTDQAGCLCNAYPNIEFNQYIEGCYSWAKAQSGQKNASAYHSYATAIANATTLCAPAPACTGCGPPSTQVIVPSPTSGVSQRGGGTRGQVWYLFMALGWVVVL